MTVVERYRAARRDPALAVLEGFHAVKHAVRFGAELLDAATVDPVSLSRLAETLAPDVADRIAAEARPVAAATFAVLSPASIPTGIIAIARRPAIDPASTLATPGSAPVAFLENPSSPFNVGAAVRVAAAACADGIFVSGRVDPWGPAALRAAAGLAWALPVGRVETLPASVRPLIAIDPDGDVIPREGLPRGAVYAFGTERDGLSALLLERADRRVRIPMRAGVSSLNLATAVAAILFGWSEPND